MTNVCTLHKHYQHLVQYHVQLFFNKYVTIVPSSCIIFFQECFEIPVLCKYIQVFISVKTTSPHERNLRAERIKNSAAQFFCVPC